jgi:penicillin G amidase
VLGRFFKYDSFPVGSSRETPMKTAHGLVNDEHGAFYGSQSRHISDLGDPDANWFLVFGGQDGWMGSENFDDQVPLWRERRYIRLPLTAAAVAEAHPTVQRLSPRRRD